MAAKILPSADFLRDCFLYDADTGRLIWKARPLDHFKNAHAWKAINAKFVGRSAGHWRDGRSSVRISTTAFWTSRVIWKLMTGADPVAQIDHINNDPSDNRFVNLRAATHQQNNINKRGMADGLKRAILLPHGRWRAVIGFNNIQYHLGVFDTAAEAHEAYVQAAHRLHGEFANTKSKIMESCR